MSSRFIHEFVVGVSLRMAHYSINEERKSTLVGAHLRKHGGGERREERGKERKMTAAREWENRWMEHRPGTNATRAFRGAPSRGSRVSISHRHCLASFLGRLQPLWKCCSYALDAERDATRGPPPRRSSRLSAQEARFLETRDTLLTVKRCRAVCEDENTRSETHFLDFTRGNQYLSYQIKIGTRSISFAKLT